jgi:hypothetical protein
MDPASLASSLVGARIAQVQLAMAAKMMKMNAESAQSVVGLIDAAQENLQQLTAGADGIGARLDITV